MNAITSGGGTVLVTGAGGFVGSAVVRSLVGLIRAGTPPLVTGAGPATHVLACVRDARAASRLAEIPPHPCWSHLRVDLTDIQALRTTLRVVGPATVIDLAGTEPTEPVLRTVIDECRRSGSRLITTSSAWVLPAGEALDESVRPDPRFPYAREKLRAERLVTELAPRSGVPWIILRLFYLFGRYEAPRRLLPSLVAALSAGRTVEVSDPERVRDFTDVDSVAGAYIAALRAPDTAWSRLYHIGSGFPISLRDFALAVAEQAGDPSLVRSGARTMPDSYLECQVADPRRAQRELDWQSPGDAHPGIKAATRWWLERIHLNRLREGG